MTTTGRLRALHQPYSCDFREWCVECAELWPCLMARLLDVAIVAEKLVQWVGRDFVVDPLCAALARLDGAS